MKEANYDFLNKCTKEELIYFIKDQFRQLFTYSDVLFLRWQKKSEEVARMRDNILSDLNEIDYKKQDELAKQFNASVDTNEKLEILKKMKPYEEAIRKHFKKYDRIRKEEDRLDRLYGSIAIQREKER